MPSPSDQDQIDRTLRLCAHATTTSAEDLRVRMVLCSDFDGEMMVDASAVDSVGQAVLQLLVAARREAAAHGQPFAIRNPSRAFLDRVHACCLSEALGLEIHEESVQ